MTPSLSRTPLKYALPCARAVFFAIGEPAGVLRGQIGIRVPGHGFRSADELRILRSDAIGLAPGWRAHGIQVGIVRVPGVRVIIEDRYTLDPRADAVDDALHFVRRREGDGLAEADCWSLENSQNCA